MTSSVVANLIRKDLRLHRLQLALTLAGGIIALAVMQRGGEVPFVLGSTWYFVAIVVLASMLPISTIVNERKKHTLTFLMSLPLSSIQYTTAKLVSTFLMFLLPWLTLLCCALALITTRNMAPHGSIPMVLIVALLPAVGFSSVRGGEKDYQYRRFQAVPVSQGHSSRWRGRGKDSIAVSKSFLGKSS